MPSREERVMRLAVPVLAPVAALALLPGAAHAKELTKARACDADGCQAITAAAKLRSMEEGTPANAPKQGAPFYRIRMTVAIDKGRTDSWTLVYVPSLGLLRTGGEFGYEWLAATPRGRRGFDRVVRGLEPQPASALGGVGVEPPRAQVDEVVLAPEPAPDGGGGLPWTLLLIPGGLALAWAAWRVYRPRLGRTAAPAGPTIER